jgi:hypothetical protein
MAGEAAPVLPPHAAALVKLRFFAGLTGSEAAEALGMSVRSAHDLWAFARSWLPPRDRAGVRSVFILNSLPSSRPVHALPLEQRTTAAHPGVVLSRSTRRDPRPTRLHAVETAFTATRPVHRSDDLDR